MNHLRTILAGVAALRGSHRAVPGALSTRAISSTDTGLIGSMGRPRVSASVPFGEVEQDWSDAPYAPPAAMKSAFSTNTLPAAPARPIKRNRAFCVFDDAPIHTWHPVWRPFGVKQELEDARNDNYTPNLSTDFETHPKLGRLTLGDRIRVGRYTSAFSVKEYPELEVEYDLQPRGSGPSVHPLLKDHWIRVELARLGKIEMPILISPTAITHNPSDLASMKTSQMQLTSDDLSICAKNGGLVRFTVRERMGESFIREGANEGMPVYAAAVIGAEMLTDLAELHKAGIIHGSVDAHNLFHMRENSAKLVLANFRRSQFVASETDKKAVRGTKDISVDSTPWQLSGSTLARRDDVYRVLEVVASLIVGRDAYTSVLSPYVSDAKALIEVKLSSMVKVFHDDPVEKLDFLSAGGKDRVALEFSDALKTVMGLESVKTPIDYNKIITHLQVIADLTIPPSIRGPHI